MSEFTCYVGEQIRRYRKAGNMTLQDLADAIHKSRATICKYENGEISVDVETLYEISQVLQVSRGEDKRARSSRRRDYTFTFMMDDPSAQRTVSLIYMKREAKPENTRRP